MAARQDGNNPQPSFGTVLWRWLLAALLLLALMIVVPFLRRFF